MSDADRPHNAMRLPRWQRRLAYAAFAWVGLSGIAWLIAHYALAGDFGAEHPLAHWSLVVHGVGAYLLLWLAGSLWPLHMRPAWRIGRNRSTGVLMSTLLAVLAASGLWLYYGAAGREAVSLIHWAIGLALVPMLVIHLVVGRRARTLRKIKEE